MIHLLIGGAKVKTVRSHLTVNDLAGCSPRRGQRRPSPMPPIEDGAAVEVDRAIGSGGITSLGGKVILAAEILAGRRVGIRIEPEVLMFFDLETRELLRTRPNPLTPAQVARLRGNRPAGPPPRPSVEPIRVQRRASKDGIIWSATRRSRSAGSTATRPSPSGCPKPRWRSSLTTVRPASSGAPPPHR